MQNNDFKRIFTNISLPIDIYTNGEFKILYDKMQIEMDLTKVSDLKNWNDILSEKAVEIGEEMINTIHLNFNQDETEKYTSSENNKNEPETFIYPSDYKPKTSKKRINITFKNIENRNTITKKKYPYQPKTSEKIN
jgi:hypothetical protein